MPKLAKGQKNYLHEPAMSLEECEAALAKGAEIVQATHANGCNIIGFGEMGIGNTSSAAILMSLYGDLSMADCVGRGTGLDDAGVQQKLQVLRDAVANNHDKIDADQPELSILATFGGFEIAMMAGAMLKAAELRMIVLVDGFIASAALLAASRLNPNVLDYCLFAHQSNEQGHQRMLKLLGAEPLVNLDMRLGEGTGVAVAYPLVKAAVSFLNEMASFESAQVSTKDE